MAEDLADNAVAVVGADGFIGRHLVHDLAAAGVEVTGWTRSRPAAFQDRVEPAVAAARTVVLVAGSINPAIAERDPAAVQAELDALTTLVGALARISTRRADPQRIVLASSGGTVYDSSRQPPYHEDDPVRPTTAYGRLKLTMEHVLERAAGAIEPVVLRLSNVYGPGQRLGTGQGVVGHWLQATADGRPLEVYGDPATSRDFVYIADVTRAVAAAHTGVGLPGVLNVGSGVATSLRELGALVNEVAGREPVDLRVVPARGFDRQDVYLDVGLARAALGWVPRTSLREGLEKTWAAMQGSQPATPDAPTAATDPSTRSTSLR